MVDLRMENPVARPTRLYRLGTRRLTRAHLTLGQRPSFRGEAGKALALVSAALGQQLACTVSARAALVDAEIRLARTLSEASAFALLELSPHDARAVVEIEKGFL